jgi:hypothetical protein
MCLKLGSGREGCPACSAVGNWGVWCCLGWCNFDNGTIRGNKEAAEKLAQELRKRHAVQYEVRIVPSDE